MSRKPTTYWDYIQLDTLLDLQHGVDGDERRLSNDEVLFITIHQIDELWFKLAIRELVFVRDLFARTRVPEQSLAKAVRGLRRIAALFHQVAGHFALMETMTTRDYLAFRSKLHPASGFQSAQLREIEILFGLKDSQRISLGHESSYMDALRNADGTPSRAYEKVASRLEDKPTLREALHEWIHRTPIHGSVPSDAGDGEVVRSFVRDYVEANAVEIEKTKAFAVHEALTAEDAERLERRYAKEIQSAEDFLLARDCEPDVQERVSRIRAAILFIESYRELPLLSWPREILDSIVAVEQAFVIFRQRHARMVERVIGRRTGTGGSAGVDYLDRTALEYRIFQDVWAVRTILLREEALPQLANPEHYGWSTDV